MTLVEILNHYYGTRALKHPDFPDSIMFIITELSETLEIWLAQKGYVRNNPQNKPEFNAQGIETELGDVIMMAQAAGMAMGLDPLTALVKKLSKRGKVSYKLSI